MAKRGLKVRDVAKDHFSSGVALAEPPFSRLVIRFLEGKDLLASDIETGKSDPVSFVWCGPMNETPNLEEADLPECGILRTSVCPTTINPIWNEDVIFPLDVTEIKSFMDMKCLIYVRDEDPHPDSMTTYDELGMLELPFKDIISKGKALKNSIVISGTWYTLAKSPGMRRVDGQVKLTLSLIFSSEDNEIISKQLPNPTENTNFSRSSINQLNSISQKVQRYLTNPIAIEEHSALSKIDPRLRLSMSSLGRPSSAKMSSRSTFSIASIAPMVKRPSTAPQKRPEHEPKKNRTGSGGNSNSSTRMKINSNSEQNSDEDDDLDEILEEEENEGERSEEGSEQGSGSEDELIVMKPKTSKTVPKQNRRYQNNSDSIGVEIGGYDLSELLHTDPPNTTTNTTTNTQAQKTLEDIIRVGVNTITASLDNELFTVKDNTTTNNGNSSGNNGSSGSTNEKEQAQKVARQIQSTAAEMASATDTDPAELLSEAVAGDEGVFEEVVRMGLHGAGSVLQHVDAEGMLKEGSKLVAKTAKAVAGDAAQVLKGAAVRAAHDILDHESGVAKTVTNAAKQQLQNIVNNPAETIVSAVVPLAMALTDSDKAKDKRILKNSPRQSHAVAGSNTNATGVTNTSANSTNNTSNTNNTTNNTSNTTSDPAHTTTAEDAYLSRIAEEEAFAVPLYSMGDQAVLPEIDDDPERPEHTSPQKRARPISAPITLTPNSGALVAYDTTGSANNGVVMSHMQLQAELKQQAQGHATAVVRALKEMSTQRKIMEKSLEKIATATAAGFSKLSERISHLEDALLTQAHNQNLAVPEGDQALQDEEEEEEVRGRDRTRNGRGLNATTPARLENKGRGTSANSTSRGKTTGTGTGATSGSKGTGNAGTSKSNRKAATSSSPPRRPNSAAATKKDTYGNVGAIAAAKAQARANKKKLLHPPFATFEDSQASSGSASFHFQPNAQLMFRGSDGRVESSALAVQAPPEAPSALQYQQQQQYGQGPSSPGRPYGTNGFVNPTSNNTNSGYNTGNNSYSDNYAPPNGNNNNLNSYYPTPNSNPYNPALQGGSITQHGSAGGSGYSMQAALPHAQSGAKYPLNKEFSSVLERGSLEDIARLLESTAPRPEDLSASVRNRLYDAVATLLHQNSHTERCLMWVLALLRGPSALLNEVVGHTVRDLREALETVALEASKRGLLASLLKSQINR